MYVVHWNRAEPCGPCPLMMSSSFLLPKIVSLIREVRNAETKENSLRRLNNNNRIIKHSKGPLVLSQGL